MQFYLIFRAWLFESGLNTNLRLNWLNPRLNFNRRIVVLFKHRLAQTLGYTAGLINLTLLAR